MARQLKYVGRPVPNTGSPSKITGGLRYTGDIMLPGMLHARILRSPFPHARIKSVNVEKAQRLEGVEMVLTHFNTPAVTYNSDLWYSGQEKKKDQELFPATVRYAGESVAAVAAVTQEIAEEALGLVEVEYEELPFVLTPDQALAEGAIPLHEGGNIAAEAVETVLGDPDGGMNSADIVVEGLISTSKMHHCAMEPHVCVADCDQEGKVTVWVPSQNVFAVRLVVAQLLGLPLSKVRVIKMPMGGSFGSKSFICLEPVASYLALKLRRPVRLEMDRRECISSTNTRHAAQFRCQAGVKRNGRLTAFKIEAVTDTGAYSTNADSLLRAMSRKAFRLYRVKDMSFKGRAVYTNTPVAGVMRGYGSPQLFAAMEIHMDQVARSIGMDPVEMRLKNLVRPGDLDPVTGQSLGGAHVISCVELGAAEFGWQKKKRMIEGSGGGTLRRGVGMACCDHPNGYYNYIQDFSTMTLKLNEDGTASLVTGLHDLGCGAITIMKQIVAEVLGIDPGHIEVAEADTERGPYDIGTQASRVTWVGGNAAIKAAEAVKAMALEVAGIYLETNPKDLCIEDGRIRRTDNATGVALRDVAGFAQSSLRKELIATETFQSVANPASYAAHFAEVEVDTETGQVKVVDYLACHDVGRALNPLLVKGQIYGGVQMGIGMALTEEIKMNPATGAVATRGLKDYTIMGMQDMPPIRVLLVEMEEEYGPFGAKAVGEIAAVPVAPAVVNAVNHALGTTIASLPATPEKILAALGKLN